jgi:hypothetical protein
MSLPHTDLQHNTAPIIETISSSIVAGFHNVTVAKGLSHPCCGRQISPQDFTLDDGCIRAICPDHHIVVLGIVPAAIADDEA